MSGVGTRLRPRTKREARELGAYPRVGGLVGELDDRFGLAKGGRVLLDKIFPDHWSFMLGEIALYSFVVIIVTGIFLTLYFVPSMTQVVYHGTYKPLDGTKVSEAYASTVNLSFAVRAGLLMRQMHHWAADVFIGAIVVHMGRIFFTGAFRKPRETNWVIGSTMLALAIIEGFLGYSLPDDLISGTGVRIADSIILSIPIVGSYLSFFLFGGNFPGNVFIERFFIIHVLILPVVIGGLIAAHLGLLVRQKHTQFAGGGRTEHNVVGSPMFPNFMAKTTGYLFMIAGLLAFLGAVAQINPIWLFGPYTADKISYLVQPDWYMGWLDGALRVMPSWEWTGWGHTVAWEVFLPAIVFPGLVFNIAFGWPAIERWFTKDDEIHNLLDRPRDRPKRTAFGVAFFSMLFMVFCASSTDALANYFHVSLNATLWFFRIVIFVVPVIVYFVTWQICREMRAAPGSGTRKVPNIVVRTAEGEYVIQESPLRPDDEPHELAPEPVPARVEMEPSAVGSGGVRPDGARSDGAGVRRVER